MKHKTVPSINFRNVPAKVYDALRDYAYHNRISMKQAFINAINELTQCEKR